MKADSKVKTLRRLKYAVRRVDVIVTRLTYLLILNTLISIACLLVITWLI